MNKNLICIVCPRGCSLDITLDDQGKFLSVTGNACPRGAKYAEQEVTHPVRTVTSTVRCHDGSVVPVKTAAPVPKELMFKVMNAINDVIAPDSLSIGDVLVENLCETGVALIVTANKNT